MAISITPSRYPGWDIPYRLKKFERILRSTAYWCSDEGTRIYAARLLREFGPIFCEDFRIDILSLEGDELVLFCSSPGTVPRSSLRLRYSLTGGLVTILLAFLFDVGLVDGYWRREDAREIEFTVKKGLIGGRVRAFHDPHIIGYLDEMVKRSDLGDELRQDVEQLIAARGWGSLEGAGGRVESQRGIQRAGTGQYIKTSGGEGSAEDRVQGLEEPGHSEVVAERPEGIEVTQVYGLDIAVLVGGSEEENLHKLLREQRRPLLLLLRGKATKDRNTVWMVHRVCKQVAKEKTGKAVEWEYLLDDRPFPGRHIVHIDRYFIRYGESSVLIEPPSTSR